MLPYARSQSNNGVQHAFVREFSKQTSTAMQIWAWYDKFKEEGCLCTRKGSGRLKTPEEKVERVRKKSRKAQRNRLEEQVLKPRFQQQQSDAP